MKISNLWIVGAVAIIVIGIATVWIAGFSEKSRPNPLAGAFSELSVGMTEREAVAIAVKYCPNGAGLLLNGKEEYVRRWKWEGKKLLKEKHPESAELAIRFRNGKVVQVVYAYCRGSFCEMNHKP